MKVSELIAKLQAAQAEHGDLEMRFNGNYGEVCYDLFADLRAEGGDVFDPSRRFIVMSLELGS